MKTIVFFYCLLLALPSISHAETAKQNTLLVTLPPLSGLVTWLAPKAEVQCLLPNNADPHHFQLTPRQVSQLQQTTLLIRSPRDDKFWSSFQTPAPTLALWPSSKHLHHGPNHAWLNPQAVMRALPLLADKLKLTYPAQTSVIQKQLSLAQKQSNMVWKAWQALVEKHDLKQRGIMMQHPSWQGLFQALGVPIRGILESAQHGQEYGPRKLEKALATLQQYPDTVLIGDAKHSNRALKWLQKHSGNPWVKLDAIGKCNTAWLQLMQYNLDALDKALQP